jgi:Plant transposon protein
MQKQGKRRSNPFLIFNNHPASRTSPTLSSFFLLPYYDRSKRKFDFERAFGIVKSRFKIPTLPRPFKMEAQSRVVPALFVLHNILVDIKVEPDLDSEDSGSEATREHQGYVIRGLVKRGTRSQRTCE